MQICKKHVVSLQFLFDFNTGNLRMIVSADNCDFNRVFPRVFANLFPRKRFDFFGNIFASSCILIKEKMLFGEVSLKLLQEKYKQMNRLSAERM